MMKKEVGLKRSMELQEAVSCIKDLAAGLEKGEVYVRQGSEFLALTPSERVFLEVKAKRKKDKEKFSLSIGWYNEELISEGEDIAISSDKPEGDVTEIEASEDDD